MMINCTGLSSAPNPEPSSEVDKDTGSEGTGADFSALLFLILATPQVPPVVLQGGDIQASAAPSDSCGQGPCAALGPVVPGQVDLLGANPLANGTTPGENVAAALQLTAVKADVVANSGLALQADIQTHSVTTSGFEQTASEVVNSLSVAAQTKNIAVDPNATQANVNSGPKPSSQLASEAAENVLPKNQDENSKANLQHPKEGQAGRDGAGVQGISPATAAEQFDMTGLDARREKQLTDPHHGGRDHSLQAAQLSTSFAGALHGSESVKEGGSVTATSAGPVVGRVANEIAAQVRQNQNEALIILEPPELGSLRIAIYLDGDRVQARILAESSETGNLIQNHLPELKEALQGHRLDLVDVHIDSGNWNSASNDLSHNFGREFGAERQWRGGREPVDSSNEASPIARTHPVATPPGRVSMWA